VTLTLEKHKLDLDCLGCEQTIVCRGHFKVPLSNSAHNGGFYVRTRRSGRMLTKRCSTVSLLSTSSGAVMWKVILQESAYIAATLCASFIVVWIAWTAFGLLAADVPVVVHP
jgi:hypothetical protein